MEVIFTIICGLFLLCFLVFIHEAGHFLVARAEGIRVTEFFLGMPSRFRLSWKSKKYGTDYGITPLLLGGYNKICGMAGALEDTDASLLAYVQEHGRVSVDEVAKAMSMPRDEVFSKLITLSDWASIEPYYDASKGEYPTQSNYPETFQTVERDSDLRTIYDSGFDSNSAKPAGSVQSVIGSSINFFDRERARTYQGKGYFQRLAILFAGPVVNLVFGVLMIAMTLWIGGTDQAIFESTKLSGVDDGSVAYDIGIQPNDEIIEVGNTSVSDWNELTDALDTEKATGKAFNITLVRNGENVTVEVPAMHENQILGIRADKEHITYSFSEAWGKSFEYLTTAAGAVAKLLIPTEVPEVVENSTSVVGITVTAGQAAEQGIFSYILLAAMVSVSLGAANLLPIPPLDGGRILVETIQVLRGRPISDRTMRYIEYAGVACFLLLFVVILQQDIVRYFLV